MVFFEKRLDEDVEFENCISKQPGKVSMSSFTMTPNDIHRNITWEKWRGTPKASTVWLLIGYIIRKRMNNPIADKIYENYYKERHLLVARYTQQGLANMFGYRDRRGINNHLKACERDSIFKIEEMPWGNRTIRIYIFGSWENKTGCNYVETFDMFTKFRKEDADKRIVKKFI